MQRLSLGGGVVCTICKRTYIMMIQQKKFIKLMGFLVNHNLFSEELAPVFWAPPTKKYLPICIKLVLDKFLSPHLVVPSGSLQVPFRGWWAVRLIGPCTCQPGDQWQVYSFYFPNLPSLTGFDFQPSTLHVTQTGQSRISQLSL